MGVRSKALPARASPPPSGSARTDRGLRRWWAILRLALVLGFRPTRRNLAHWLSWIATLGLELALTVVLRSGVVYGWERTVTRVFQQVPQRAVIFDAANFLTNTLTIQFVILFVLIVGAVFLLGRRLDATLLLLSFPLHVLVQFPKALVDRPRPSGAFTSIDGVGGLRSFPSGHAEFVVTFWGFLAYLAMLRLRRRWQQVAVVLAWAVLALAIGFGRIAMGRHWPLDIASSYLFGAGALSGLIWLRASLLAAIAAFDQRDSPAGPEDAAPDGER